jgi:hypothetical protein
MISIFSTGDLYVFMLRVNAFVAVVVIAAAFLCMIHDPCIIRIYTVMLPTNARQYIKISLNTQ